MYMKYSEHRMKFAQKNPRPKRVLLYISHSHTEHTVTRGAHQTVLKLRPHLVVFGS